MDKKFTAREAAIAVLRKAEELYKASTLAKAEKPLEKKYEGFKAVEESARKSGASDPAAVAAAAGRKKYGKEAFQEAAAEGKKMKKSDAAGNNPDEKADAALGEKVEQDVQHHEENNEDPGHAEPVMKGHIKLAKFMGAMEAKRGKRPGAIKKDDGQTLGQTIGYPGSAPAPAPSPSPMAKAEESKHDRCAREVKENSPDVKNPHAVCVAEGVKPAKWSK